MLLAWGFLQIRGKAVSSGKQHDCSIKITTPCVWLGVYSSTHNVTIASLITVGHVIGGLWLSPDLDLDSLPFKRWGLIKCIWLPYQRLIPHRGRFFNRNPLSHAPIVGTGLRLLYLAAIVAGAIALLDAATNSNLGSSLISAINKNQNILSYAASGIEVSAFIHLVMDITATYSRR